MDEQQLLANALNGDRAAYKTLVEENSRQMYALAWRILQDAHLAEDAVQDALIKAFNQLQQFDRRSKFSTWLYRITSNCAIDLQRKQRRHEGQSESDEVLERMTEEAGHPDYELRRRDLESKTRESLEKLSSQERLAFSLKHFDGRSINEISQILELTENSVKQAIFRAVKKLKADLMPLMAQ